MKVLSCCGTVTALTRDAVHRTIGAIAARGWATPKRSGETFGVQQAGMTGSGRHGQA